MRENKVTLLRNAFGVIHLVVSQKYQRVTKVFSFHPFSDLPSYLSIPFADVYTSHPQAINSIKTLFNSEIIKEGVKLLGYTKEHNTLIFGFITEISPCAEIAGRFTVNLVNKVEFIRITNSEIEENSEYDAFPLEEFHYFSEYMDISRPFPSSEVFGNPDLEFCWNQKWRDPFVKIGCNDVCVILMQGYCSSFAFMGYSLSFIVRRAVLNPGVRYIARGLNENNEPGNECECEFIFSSPNNELWTHIYRRGSMPLRWQTNNKLLKVEHIVNDESCNGTKQYFKRLQKRYFGGQIFCLCLLKSEPGSSESELVSSFNKVVNNLKNDNTVRIFSFDLNKIIDESGSSVAGEEMLKLLGPLATICDFSYSKNAFQENGMISSNIKWETRQMCSLRINCADSLDRTNIASFFLSLILTSEWSRRTGLTSEKAPLFSPEKPVKYIKREVLEFLVESFLRSGDIISLLYTNTPAVKSNIIRQYSDIKEQSESDTSISVKRRIFNTFTDPQRQKLFEKWTKIPRLNPVFFLDHMKTQCASIGFPYEVLYFNGSTDECLITNSKSLQVLFPFDIKVTAIYFHIVPMELGALPEAMTIEGFDGNEYFTIDKNFKLPTAQESLTIKVPIKSTFCRIIKFTFHQVTKMIQLGPISFEGTFEGKEPFIQEKSCQYQTPLDEFVLFVQEAAKERPVPFEAAQNLELQRIQLTLSRDQFNHACFRSYINPCIFLPIVEKNKCIFCGRPATLSHFSFSPVLEQRIYVSLTTDRDDKIYVCDNCLEKANLLVRQTAGIHKELKYDDEDHKKLRKQFDYRKYDLTIPHRVSKYDDIYVIRGATSGILNGTSSVTLDQSRLFVFALPYPCEIEHLEVHVDKIPETFEVLVMNETGSFDKTIVSPKEGNMLWIGITKAVSLRQLAVSMNPSSSVVVSKIEIFGVPYCYEPNFIRGFHNSKKFTDFSKKEVILPTFDDFSLTHNFTSTKEVQKLCMKVEKAAKFDQTLAVVFYKGSEIIQEETIKIGESLINSTFYYPIRVSSPFALCSVYHLECKNPSECSNITFFIL